MSGNLRALLRCGTWPVRSGTPTGAVHAVADAFHKTLTRLVGTHWAPPMQHWQLQEAKARMSELVKRAQEGPQGTTLHGKPLAVLVSQAAFEQALRRMTWCW